ncbi:MAG TPA: EamA family transporter RarD [Sphingobium sp.]
MASQEDEGGPPANGIAYALGCYFLWGLLPLYFHMLDGVASTEVVAQRIVWSLVLVIGIIAARTGMGAFLSVLRDRRVMLPLCASALLIAVNWLTYIWAVHNDHVIAASLGYFLNPLVNILLGFLFLKEQLRRGQMIAVVVAALGVAILAAAALDTLWISLTLALSFGFYGLVRKTTPVAPMRGLGAETVLLTPLAIVYLLWLNAHGGLAFGTDPKITVLLILSGAITAMPLLLFAIAAQSLSMATLGIMQYLAPTLQFLTGILIFGEALSRGQMISFSLIWIGLILFTIDSLRGMRAARLAAV